MSYRDELHAAQSRIAELEAKLQVNESAALAKKTGATDIVVSQKSDTKVERFTGIKRKYKKVTTIPGAFAQEGHRPLVIFLEMETSSRGTMESSVGFFRWAMKPKNIPIEVVVQSFHNETQIKAFKNFDGLAGGVFGGVGGNVGAWSIIMGAGLAGTVALPFVAIAPVGLGLGWLGCRGIVKHFAKKSAKSLDDLWPKLVAEVKRFTVVAEPPKK